MIVLPAIDLKGGKCVRLSRGDYDTALQVAEDAVETARSFQKAGAKILHMVDLDAAKSGQKTNYEIVHEVIQKTGLMVELGGGIRRMDDLDNVFSLGVYRAIIGSAAVSDARFVKRAVEKYGDRVAVGIDALSETVRTAGWGSNSGHNYIEFAAQMEKLGVKTVIFTDIDKDGMLSGPSFEKTFSLASAVNCDIIASGGIASIGDLRRLRDGGIAGAIVGKAVYAGLIDIEAAIREVE